MREACPASGLALAALALAAAGCALVTPHFERPELTVTRLELKDARLSEQHFRVRLRVTNPNARALPVQAIHCRLELAGARFGDGESTGAFTVPAHGSTDFDLLVTTDLAGALAALLPRLKAAGPPLDYRLQGSVDTGLAFARSIPFDQRGTLK